MTVSPSIGVEKAVDFSFRTGEVAGSVTSTIDYLDGKGTKTERAQRKKQRKVTKRKLKKKVSNFEFRISNNINI